MIGEILEIDKNKVKVKNSNSLDNIINMYVKIYNDKELFVGEVESLTKELIIINLMGEISNNKFTYGVSKKPSLSFKVALLNDNEIKILFNLNTYNPKEKLYLGKSALYNNYPIYASINNMFSSHLVVLGNSGSGKSCGVARILQNLFYKQDAECKNATIFIIDAYGEYKNAFSMINYVHKDLMYKNYTSDMNSDDELIKIPLWLLSVDDLCLLLEVSNKNQIPIIEKALKLVNVFKREEEDVIKSKNSIIASSIIDIFINGKNPAQIRDQIISVLTMYNTKDLNLDTPIVLPGYTRPLKQCIMIDNTGKIRDTELVIKFLQEYVLEELKLDYPDGSYIFTLKDLLYAFDFALIDEGMLSNENIYNLANELRVKLASIVDSDISKFFEFDRHYTKKDFFNYLTHVNDTKCQIINFNLNGIDDRLAKVIAKIYSKFLFDYAKCEIERGSVPIHILLEEAHRYVQMDTDLEFLGYNIFERIAKEGRKYGVLLDLISQRPSELSQTVLSQCSNFIVFKITHPKDLDYIKPMIPFISEELIEKIKNLPVGNCLTFGSLFTIPTIVKVDPASPLPSSSSCDIANTWF